MNKPSIGIRQLFSDGTLQVGAERYSHASLTACKQQSFYVLIDESDNSTIRVFDKECNFVCDAKKVEAKKYKSPLMFGFDKAVAGGDKSAKISDSPDFVIHRGNLAGDSRITWSFSSPIDKPEITPSRNDISFLMNECEDRYGFLQDYINDIRKGKFETLNVQLAISDLRGVLDLLDLHIEELVSG